MLKRLLLLIWALVLAGCATTNRMPAAQATANIRELLAELKQLKAVSTLYLDTNYYLPTQAEALSWFAAVKWHPYQTDSWDCDDYALQCALAAREANQALRPGFAPAVGIMVYETDHATVHAINIFRSPDATWHAYDPTLRLEISWPAGAIYYVIL